MPWLELTVIFLVEGIEWAVRFCELTMNNAGDNFLRWPLKETT